MHTGAVQRQCQTTAPCVHRVCMCTAPAQAPVGSAVTAGGGCAHAARSQTSCATLHLLSRLSCPSTEGSLETAHACTHSKNEHTHSRTQTVHTRTRTHAYTHSTRTHAPTHTHTHTHIRAHTQGMQPSCQAVVLGLLASLTKAHLLLRHFCWVLQCFVRTHKPMRPVQCALPALASK